MLAAFREWAEAPQKKHTARLKELAVAFLDRKKLFYSPQEPQSNPVEDSFRKARELEKVGARDRFDFYHDDAKFRSYKDFGRSHARTDEGVAGSEAIFLSDGDPAQPAVPVEHDSRAIITPAVADGRTTPLNRVFVYRDFESRLSKPH